MGAATDETVYKDAIAAAQNSRPELAKLRNNNSSKDFTQALQLAYTVIVRPIESLKKLLKKDVYEECQGFRMGYDRFTQDELKRITSSVHLTLSTLRNAISHNDISVSSNAEVHITMRNKDGLYLGEFPICYKNFLLLLDDAVVDVSSLRKCAVASQKITEQVRKENRKQTKE
jgi:hypothetical protein